MRGDRDDDNLTTEWLRAKISSARCARGCDLCDSLITDSNRRVKTERIMAKRAYYYMRKKPRSSMLSIRNRQHR